MKENLIWLVLLVPIIGQAIDIIQYLMRDIRNRIKWEELLRKLEEEGKL